MRPTGCTRRCSARATASKGWCVAASHASCSAASIPAPAPRSAPGTTTPTHPLTARHAVSQPLDVFLVHYGAIDRTFKPLERRANPPPAAGNKNASSAASDKND